MNPTSTLPNLAIVASLMLSFLGPPAPARAGDGQELQKDARAALKSLFVNNPKAKVLDRHAIAVLVFPSVKKAGLFVGGQYGEGVLFERGKVTGYYSTAGASVGLQAGAQVYGYAMFFLSKKTLDYLAESEGLEVGVGPSVVIANEGVGKNTTTTTTKDNIYAFIFDQKGAMAALGIQGNKISRIKK